MKVAECVPCVENYCSCLIFYVADNWKENPDFVLYLTKLGSFGVEQLSKQTSVLT